MTLSIEHHFANWESHVFGFGYGTGEPHILTGLKHFFSLIGSDNGPNSYDYNRLESCSPSPLVAWLFINAMCRNHIFEYGTSPRYGWLTPQGERLRAFIDYKTEAELIHICTSMGCEEQTHCGPNTCNCGEFGYVKGKKCDNPFFR